MKYIGMKIRDIPLMILSKESFKKSGCRLLYMEDMLISKISITKSQKLIFVMLVVPLYGFMIHLKV